MLKLSLGFNKFMAVVTTSCVSDAQFLMLNESKIRYRTLASANAMEQLENQVVCTAPDFFGEFGG